MITKEILDWVEKKVWLDDKQRKCLSLGNSRLDFKKTYFFNGFGEKTVLLSWQNGESLIKCQGKIEDKGDYYSLHTEGWSFIEHIEKVKP